MSGQRCTSGPLGGGFGGMVDREPVGSALVDRMIARLAAMDTIYRALPYGPTNYVGDAEAPGICAAELAEIRERNLGPGLLFWIPVRLVSGVWDALVIAHELASDELDRAEHREVGGLLVDLAAERERFWAPLREIADGLIPAEEPVR